MIRFIRDLRLVPITVIASLCLLALKAADFMLDSGPPPNTADLAPVEAETIIRTPGVPRPSDPHRSWAQQMFNFPDSSGGARNETDLASLPVIPPLSADRNTDIITGSVAEKPAEKKPEEKNDAKAKGEGADAGKDGAAAKKDKEGKAAGKEGQPANPPPGPPDGKVVLPDVRPLPSAAERALLERLSERRQELDKRARELDIREGLIAEAEKRIEAKLAEIKDGEAHLATAAEKKDEAEIARFKGLVTMYENMKPRDAAKIFEHLETSVLIEVASQINPRRMADILAQMTADAADKLTVELANRAKAVNKAGQNADLPKIEGRPVQ